LFPSKDCPLKTEIKQEHSVHHQPYGITNFGEIHKLKTNQDSQFTRHIIMGQNKGEND